MKRFLCLALALCLLLCGCGGKVEETTPATTIETTPDITSEPTTEPTVPETTEAPIIYRHPLNGQQLDAPWTGRATAVVINNLKEALPQHGIGQADILYELETESGITRFLAVFSDIGQVGTIGPVRSARTFFNNIAVSHDAVLVHCGGSQFALNGNYSINGDSISNWQHLDQMSNGSYFYRDSARRASGYAYEHTLFTKGESLLKGITDKAFPLSYEGEAYDQGLLFAEEPGITGTSATSATVKFRNSKTTTFDFDIENGVYKASQYGSAWMDASAGEQLTFRNVIAIITPQSFRSDAYYSRSFYELSGSGKGYLICDGQIVPILWNRASLRSAFTYTYEDGTPVILGVGSTYVGVVDSARGGVTFE